MQRPDAADFRTLLVPFLILAAVIVADQATKSLAAKHLSETDTISLIGTFLQLKLIYNYGGALGTNFGSGTFYLITSLVILGVIFYFIYANRNIKWVAWPMSLCAGGAIGNIIDRVLYGKVTDFIDMDFFDFNLFGISLERWWTYNIADAAITVGIVIIIVYILFFSHHRETAPSPSLTSGERPAAES